MERVALTTYRIVYAALQAGGCDVQLSYSQCHCYDRFHIIGGECNYLLRFSPVTKRLEFVPDEEWMTPCMQQWRQEDIQYVLREAEKLLMDTAYRLRLPIKVQPCSYKLLLLLLPQRERLL